jgi:hypothetical protein
MRGAAMTKTALKTGVAMACVASLIGCQRAQTGTQARINCPPPVTPVTVPSVVDSAPYPIRVQADCINANTPVPVVHITLWNVEDLHLESSVLLQYPSDQHGNKSQGRTVQPNPTPLPNPTPYPKTSTYVDFDARAYLTGPGKVVLIELELKDPGGYAFKPGKDNAVYTSDAANGQMFCVKAPMVVPPNQKLVSFYARYVPPVGNKSLYGAYHFRLVTPQGTDFTDVKAVDPKVQNNG